MKTEDDTSQKHLLQAVRRLAQIAEERELLKGHFTKVAKEYGIKVKDLKIIYATYLEIAKPLRVEAYKDIIKTYREATGIDSDLFIKFIENESKEII